MSVFGLQVLSAVLFALGDVAVGQAPVVTDVNVVGALLAVPPMVFLEYSSQASNGTDNGKDNDTNELFIGAECLQPQKLLDNPSDCVLGLVVYIVVVAVLVVILVCVYRRRRKAAARGSVELVSPQVRRHTMEMQEQDLEPADATDESAIQVDAGVLPAAAPVEDATLRRKSIIQCPLRELPSHAIIVKVTLTTDVFITHRNQIHSWFESELFKEARRAGIRSSCVHLLEQNMIARDVDGTVYHNYDDLAKCFEGKIFPIVAEYSTHSFIAEPPRKGPAPHRSSNRKSGLKVQILE